MWATIAVESALTGHLVLSTLHTNDAPTAITRLIEMGIEPFLVASAIDCVVAQRLARTLCTTCKRRTLIPARRKGFPHVLDLLFGFLMRNAVRAADFFQIPPSRVVELGAQVVV